VVRCHGGRVGVLAAAFSPGPIRGLELVNNPLGIEGAPNVVVVQVLIFGLGIERQHLCSRGCSAPGARSVNN
jgi:hypothetical protein